MKWRKLKISIPTCSFIVIKELLKDCFYPFLSRISSVVMANSQSFILAIFINPTLAAVYDITNKIPSVACNFVSMANGSFFGLFSLTFAKKDVKEINKLIHIVSVFFLTILFSVLLYSLIFTKVIVSLWVGLDKYGGDFLLELIVIAFLINQLKQYFNNLLYTGGMINKSAKLDILCMLLYVILLLILIKSIQIYSIPVATFGSGIFFIGMYLRLLKHRLDVDINIILGIILKMMSITIPFAIIHYLLRFDLFNIYSLIIYAILFTVLYVVTLWLTNRKLFILLYQRLRNEDKK